MSSILKCDSILNSNGNAFDGSQLANVGKVLQVKQTVLADPVVTTTSGTTGVDIGLSVNITPSSSASKILIQATVQIGGDGSAYDAGFALERNGIKIALPNNYGSRNGCFMPYCNRAMSTYETETVSGIYLDSPSTTNQITYRLMAVSNNTISHYINRGATDADNFGDSRHISTITVMEIGA